MTETAKLLFGPVTKYDAGTIEGLLTESYAGLAGSEEECEKYRAKWRQADRETFENHETVGRCTFITTLNGEPIGFGSFAPRGGPDVGIIGQNVIIPAYRGRGFGRRQMEEILRRLQALDIRKAVATTGEHSFFIAAQEMYLACGFRETRRFQKDDEPRIEYQKEL